MKSLERTTEGWRVGLREKETVESEESQEDSVAELVPDGSGTD